MVLTTRMSVWTPSKFLSSLRHKLNPAVVILSTQIIDASHSLSARVCTGVAYTFGTFVNAYKDCQKGFVSEFKYVILNNMTLFVQKLTLQFKTIIQSKRFPVFHPPTLCCFLEFLIVRFFCFRFLRCSFNYFVRAY